MAMSLIEKLQQVPEYEDCFISGQEALLRADSDSLLVVVDTNRPDQVEALELLESISRITVIDHHRRAADYIQNVVLNLHEPFASSASELVAELLEYSVEPRDILPVESESLLAGIVLDTKHFSVRTGGRTFEAAAFLRRTGADTVDVKKMFQSNLDDTLSKYKIIQAARLYRGGTSPFPHWTIPPPARWLAGGRRAAQYFRDSHLVCTVPRWRTGGDLRPFYRRCQCPGDSRASGWRRQRRNSGAQVSGKTPGRC